MLEATSPAIPVLDGAGAVVASESSEESESSELSAAASVILEALPESSNNIEYIADKENIAAAIIENLEEGDMVVTLGAGDINMVGRQILFMLRKRGA